VTWDRRLAAARDGTILWSTITQRAYLRVSLCADRTLHYVPGTYGSVPGQIPKARISIDPYGTLGCVGRPQPSSESQSESLAGSNQLTLLERGYPFRAVSLLIQADRRLHDPTYGAHRWWARRPPGLLRSLLLAAALPADVPNLKRFWTAYRSDEPLLAGLHVHDPFIGGGSTLVEAARLGADVSGYDVDPLAVEIVRYELRPAPATAIREAGRHLLEHVRGMCGHLYPTVGQKQPLHYFWLHKVTCPKCRHPGLLYRNLVLARDRGKPGAVVRDHPLTVFCPEDLSIHHLASADRVELRHGGRRWRIADGTFVKNRYWCPDCGEPSTHKELRTGMAPRILVAVEDTAPQQRRVIRKPSAKERDSTQNARRWILANIDDLEQPNASFSDGRNDERPLSYGIEKIAQLFTDRQLATLGAAFHWLQTSDLSPDIRAGLRLALSNSLATNNKLCSYATDYGRLSALFSVRGYSLPSLAVELNPLHPESGRGTLYQCIERVAKAGQTTTRRHVWSVANDKPELRDMKNRASSGPTQVVNASAITAETESSSSVYICIFDPPYFDYIAYNELSEFYSGWTGSSVLAGAPLLPSGDEPSDSFGLELGLSIQGALKRLMPGRP